MKDSIFGKIILKILPFITLLLFCMLIILVFGKIGDYQLEKMQNEQQQQEQQENGNDDVGYVDEYEDLLTDSYEESDLKIDNDLDQESLEQFRDCFLADETDAKSDAIDEEIDETAKSIEEWINTHSLEEKVAQLFIVTPEAIDIDSFKFTEVSENFVEEIKNYPVGGYIFFGSNLIDREQTINMLSNIEKAYEDNEVIAPFLAVDEEGGLVARIGNNPNFDVESTVPMSEIGATGDTTYAYEAGKYIGSYLYDLGFNMNMAPDADVLSNPENTVIGNRSFGSDSELVAEMVIAEAKALDEEGIIFAIKHFPGHGATTGDSHNGYAYTDKSLDELLECELVPFAEAIKNDIGVIMVGHISLPNVTGDDLPASISYTMVTEILREQLGFNGIVITDAMNMGAITQQYTSAEAAVLSLKAGVDIILMPHDFVEAYEGILEAVESGEISEERIDESIRRILREKI